MAVGAVLKFAVTATLPGISLATVGTILIVVGVIGLLVALVFLMQAGRGQMGTTRERFNRARGVCRSVRLSAASCLHKPMRFDREEVVKCSRSF